MRGPLTSGPGGASQQQGRYEEAEENYEEVLELARVSSATAEARAHASTTSQRSSKNNANTKPSIPLFELSIELDRQVDDLVGMAITLVNLGLATMGIGEVERAYATGCEALELSVEVGHKWGIATAFDLLAKIAAADNAPDRAVRLFRPRTWFSAL